MKNNKNQQNEIQRNAKFKTTNYNYVKQIVMILKYHIGQIVFKDYICLLQAWKTSMLNISLFALNRQMKIIKKFDIDFLDLFLMNNSYQFVINTYWSIQIWKFNDHQNWEKCSTIIQLSSQDSNYILSIALNKKDDLIVSATRQGIISFLSYKLDWKCQQVLDSSFINVIFLEFNEAGNFLIVVGIDYFGLINLQQNGKWEVCHKISGRFETVGFIGYDLYAYVFQNEAKINLAKLCNINERAQNQDIQLPGQQNGRGDCLFYLKYIKTRGFSLAITTDGLFYIKIHKDGNIEVEQQTETIFLDQLGRVIACSQNQQFLFIIEMFTVREIDWSRFQVRKGCHIKTN